MDLGTAAEFIREHHRAVLVTYKKDGSPQTSPVVVGAAGTGGRAAISSRETAYKVKNLRRDPRASLCVFTDGFFGPWVQIDGTVEIVSLPDAMEMLTDYYRSISGEHPDWDEYRSVMEKEQRVMVLVDIEAAGPDAAG